MDRQKTLVLISSAVMLAVLVTVVARALASFDRRILQASHAVLYAGADSVERQIASGDPRLASIAEELARDPELATDFKAFTVAMNVLGQAAAQNERIKARLDGLRQKVEERVSGFRDKHNDVDAIALIDVGGTVVISTGGRLKVGSNLADTANKEVDGKKSEQNNDRTRGESDDLVNKTLSGYSGSGLATYQGAVHFVGAAPVYLKNAVLAGVLVERKLQALPQASGVDALILIDGAVAMGQPPKGYVAGPIENNKDPFLLVPRDGRALVPILGDISFAPLFVDPTFVGVWAQRFEIPSLPAASGLVFTDLSPIFSEIAGIQFTTIVSALVLWLLLSGLVMMSGSSSSGIRRLTDFLGRYHQNVGDETAVNERGLSPDLVRLARLINKTIEEKRRKTGPTPLAKAPSVEDVLQAQAVAAAVENSDLEFQGISDSGSIGGTSTAPAPAQPSTTTDADDTQHADAFLASKAKASLNDVMAASEATATPVDELDMGLAPSKTESTRRPTVPNVMATLAQAQRPEMDPNATAVMKLPPKPVLPPPMETQEPEPADDFPLPFAKQPLPTDEAPTPPPARSFTSADSGSPAQGDRETYYRQIFEEFVATRRSCGESYAELTFDKFRTKLETSRAAVVAKHNCTDVKFQVYVKEGKAALKATPAR